MEGPVSIIIGGAALSRFIRYQHTYDYQLLILLRTDSSALGNVDGVSTIMQHQPFNAWGLLQ